MIAIKPTQMRNNFKTLCDKVVSGETIIISRPNNENVVRLFCGSKIFGRNNICYPEPGDDINK